MYNIAIIGAGQLGSRHLQGLKTARLPMFVQVVDNNIESLELALSRYDEVKCEHSVETVEYLNSIDNLETILDLVIVATGSLPRAAILNDLLSKKRVKNLVLEKVLFPSIKQYSQIRELLQQHDLLNNTWVNCTRRMFDYYPVVKDIFATETKLSMVVDGDWGMACNSIHFIDIMSYITGSYEWTFQVGYDSKIVLSKRNGYVEIEGVIEGISERGDKIMLMSSPTHNEEITIFSDNTKLVIDAANKILVKNDKFLQSISIKFQSQLTGILAEDILLNHSCRLTPYEQSEKLHLAFLIPVVDFYNKKTNNNGDNCPIT